MLSKVRGQLATQLPLFHWASSLCLLGSPGVWEGEVPGPRVCPAQGTGGGGLALGSASLHKGLQKPASWQETGGWLGTTPGWDALILGVQIIGSTQVREGFRPVLGTMDGGPRLGGQ